MMNRQIILRKTAKGQHEIKSRASGLSPQQRLVLIMVNGELSYDDLYAKLDVMVSFDSSTLLEPSLAELNELGLITDSSNRAERVRSNYGRHSWSEQRVLKVKKEMIRVAEAMLKTHSDKIINKIESSPNTLEGLANVIEKSERLVVLFIGEEIAQDLSNKWRAVIKQERKGLNNKLRH